MSFVSKLYRSPVNFTQAAIEIDGTWYRAREGLVSKRLTGGEARQALVAWGFGV